MHPNSFLAPGLSGKGLKSKRKHLLNCLEKRPSAKAVKIEYLLLLLRNSSVKKELEKRSPKYWEQHSFSIVHLGMKRKG